MIPEKTIFILKNKSGESKKIGEHYIEKFTVNHLRKSMSNFYAHTNWLELGNINLQSPAGPLPAVATSNKQVGKVNSILQEFRNLKPSILINLINTFASSMYGSSLWCLLSAHCEKLHKALPSKDYSQ